MNIATGKLEAPLVKEAGIESILEYLGSGGAIGKFLPEALSSNHALRAGLGAAGSETTRRLARRAGANAPVSELLGQLGAAGSGGYAGMAGAGAARLMPSIGGSTRDVAAGNLAAWTGLGAGTEHLGKGILGLSPQQVAGDLFQGAKTLGSPLAPSVAVSTPITGSNLWETLRSALSRGAGETTALGESGLSALKNLAAETKGELGSGGLYKALASGLGGTAALAAGASHLSPSTREWVAGLPGKIADNPGKALAVGGLGLLGAGAPVLGTAGLAAAALRPSVRDPIVQGAKYLRDHPQGGAALLPAAIGAGALGAPVVAGGLATAAALKNRFIRKQLAAGGRHAGKAVGHVGGGVATGAKWTGKGTKNVWDTLPQGTVMGAGGAAATAMGMPMYGVPAMLAAPLSNRKLMGHVGDVSRALQSNKRTQQELAELYKKSSYEGNIKLAAPVYRTRPAYILDAPTMDKVSWAGFVEATSKFLKPVAKKARGAASRLVGGETSQVRRLRKAYERGARKGGQNLSAQQIQTGADRAAAQVMGKPQVLASKTKAPVGGDRFQFEGLNQSMDTKLRQGGVDQGSPLTILNPATWRQRFRNRGVYNENLRQMEKQVEEIAGPGGTAPTAPTVNLQPARDSQAALTKAEQRLQRQGRGYLDPTTGTFVRGAEGDAIAAERAARRGVTRLTAPVETAQASLTAAEQQAQQARQQYFRGNFGIDAPTQSLAELEANLPELMRLDRMGDQTARNTLAQVKAQIKALKATEAAVSSKGLPSTQVEALLKQDEAALQTTYRGLEQKAVANTITSAEKKRLEELRKFMQYTPASSSQVTEVATAGSNKINTVVARLSKKQRGKLNLKNNSTPEEIQQAIADKLTQLEQAAAAGTISNKNEKLLAKLQGARVRVTKNTPESATFMPEGQAGLNTRLKELQKNLAHRREYRKVLKADKNVEPLRAPVQQAQEALTPAEQALRDAQRNLGSARQKTRALESNTQYQQKHLDAAQAQEAVTQDLLNAPISGGAASKLEAPVAEAVASKTKAPVAEHLSSAGLNDQLNTVLSTLQTGGADVGKVVSKAAKRSGLNKAVKDVGVASDAFVMEHAAALPQLEQDALKQAVRRLSSQKRPLADLNAALVELGVTPAGELNTVVTSMAAENMPKALTTANEAVVKANAKFNNLVAGQSQRQSKKLRDVSYNEMRGAKDKATKDRSWWERKVTDRKGVDLTAEQKSSYDALESLTNARVQAMTTSIGGKGANALVLEAARPQLNRAGAAVLETGNPMLVNEWSHILQQPQDINVALNKATKELQNHLRTVVPELLDPKKRGIFKLDATGAQTLEKLIPRQGRGAGNIVEEVSKVFNPKNLNNNSSTGQELVSNLNTASPGLGDGLVARLETGTPEAKSAVNKLFSDEGASVGKYTKPELEALNISIKSKSSKNWTDPNAEGKFLDAINNRTLDQAESHITSQLNRVIGQQRRGGVAHPDVAPLEEAFKYIQGQRGAAQKQLKKQYTENLTKARTTLTDTIKQDVRIDTGGLVRNVDVAKVTVPKEVSSISALPVTDSAGNLVYDPNVFKKQLELLKKQPENANMPVEVLAQRLVNEGYGNTALLKEVGVGVTQAAEAQGSGAGLLAKAVGGTAATGAVAYNSRGGRGGPVTSSRNQALQPQGSWGLSPLAAPVMYRKKVAALSPPVKYPKPKDLQLGASPTTATHEAFMAMRSKLSPPVQQGV